MLGLGLGLSRALRSTNIVLALALWLTALAFWLQAMALWLQALALLVKALSLFGKTLEDYNIRTKYTIGVKKPNIGNTIFDYLPNSCSSYI